MGFFKKDVVVVETSTIVLSQVKSEIRVFLGKEQIPRYELEVTDISLEVKDNQCKVTIVLCNLGKLIGKNGNIIKNLSTHLSNTFDKKFFINAVESDLWK